MRHHRFLREALEEYEDAIAYYETLRQGLGASLILDFDRVMATTLEFPLMGALVDGAPVHLGIRRRLLRRFIAVFHGKRRPGYWKDRLSRLP